MKRKQIQPLITIILFIIVNSCIAQVPHSKPSIKGKSDIVLYSITGISFLNYSNLHGLLSENNADYPGIAMNLGAGYYSTFGKVRLGMDFGSTNGSSENIQYLTKHYGSFFSINLGYHILEKNGFIVAPVIAYSSRRNNVLIENKKYAAATLSPFSSNSTSLTNNTNALKLQISTEKILKNGLFAGLSFGYDYSLTGEQTWRLSNESNPNFLQDNMSAFYINLSIGTHLNYSK
jgi:hypothetical protein